MNNDFAWGDVLESMFTWY